MARAGWGLKDDDTQCLGALSMATLHDANRDGTPEPRPNARSLEEFATAINGLHRNSVENIHAIGRLILEARIELPKEDYQLMLREKLDFGPRNARLYMTV